MRVRTVFVFQKRCRNASRIDWYEGQDAKVGEGPLVRSPALRVVSQRPSILGSFMSPFWCHDPFKSGRIQVSTRVVEVTVWVRRIALKRVGPGVGLGKTRATTREALKLRAVCLAWSKTSEEVTDDHLSATRKLEVWRAASGNSMWPAASSEAR